ncbi:MAG: hypothetical protein ABIP42_06720 [Planctomycetota bacterium]
MAEEGPDPPAKSFGAMSEHHWSRARRDSNQEALEYYRQRSKAPGVAEGGAERNFYCMECDGVIPHDAQLKACPHCGVALEEGVKRYFNWVEMGEPRKGDLRALMPVFAIGLAVLAVLAFLLLRWLL